MKKIVVAGIGTGIGKTVVSTILTEALEADYWKPVQSGNLDFTDTDFVRSHITNTKSFFHPERYRLVAPLSPHAAAKADGIEIKMEELSIPVTGNVLIIELAGGLMVPLNDTALNLDLLKQWDAEVVLVAQNYLGSINHTLLSVAVLKQQGITIKGIIFNGASVPASEQFILRYTGIHYIGSIQQEKEINKRVIKHYADTLREQLRTL
jgi:dethiobiotin synthetase